MASVHDVTALTQAVREKDFHVLRVCKGHGIQVCIQPRHQTLAATSDDPRRFDALFVILEALFRRESRHADVVRGFSVACRVPEEDDVDMMMVL
jgi:hypothetical protein